MKIIVFLTVLILILPASIFGSEIDNIIKQQKENKEKEAGAKNKKESEQEAMDRCIDGVTKVIASKIQELLDKGVEFKKNPGVWSYKNISGKRYATFSPLHGGDFVRTSMYDDKFLVLSGGNITIQFRPENGETVYIGITFYVSNKWKLETRGPFTHKMPETNKVIEFKSIYDINEIEKKRDMINNNVVKAIEAAIKYDNK